MPSISHVTPGRSHGRSARRRVSFGRRPKTQTFRFKKGTKIGARRRATRGNQNVTRLTTLSRKSENVSISYREELDFSQMGYDAGSSPCLIRANLNQCVGLDSDRAVTVVGSIKTGSTDPTFTRSSYNQKANLRDRLSDYFDEYRSAIVTSAEVTFNVRPKLNQVSPTSDVATVSIVPYFTNDATGLDPAGNAGLRGATQQTRWIGANATGDLYVWCIRQSAQQQLYDSTNGVASLADLKQGIPGMRMSKLNITPNSTKGVVFKMKYTPRSQFQIKDWRDNRELFEMTLNDVQSDSFKHAYAYLGIGARINGQDASGSANGKYLANCIVEVTIKYNINFSERKNVMGNNEPNPHYSEL